MARRLLFATITALLLSTTALPAYGQDREPTQAQLELNEEGVEAIVAGDYDRAIRLFEASLALGELNITFINMARAYQRAGQCEEAEEFYEAALRAPAVSRPTPAQIRGAIGQYREEMRQTCPGYLEITCNPAELSLFINDEGPQICGEERRELEPGDYAVRGEFEGNVTETSVTIEALRTSRINLGLSSAQVSAPTGAGIGEFEAPAAAERGVPGWAFLAGSGAFVAGGIVLDTVPATARNQEFDALDVVPIVFYAAGIGLAAYGIWTYLRD